ncbi:MAG: FAD-dependent thymidylate synthase [Sulfolobales archaeon]|jgi:thymidylate synthase (FAD)
MILMRVRLISYNCVDGDVRKLVLLGFKVSAGKVRENGVDYYLKEYQGDLSSWILEGVKYPSVLEHITFTFYIEGISRVTSHQLIRHRIASYTQESQRYSPTSKEYVIPESIVKAGFEVKYRELIEECFKLYSEMIKSGVPYEDARYILPQAVTTRLIMTVNLRELLHIACLRLSKGAQWEIKELVKEMINEVGKILPEIHKLLESYCGEEL